MKVFTTRAELAEEAKQAAIVPAEFPADSGEKLPKTGFVPTMGALHEGHLALVDRARKENALVVVSIFVNPTQFNDPADLRNYPRTLESDLKKLADAGVDWVYAPEIADIYPEPDTRQFDFGTLDKVMEGAHRPGHFNGVAQVVSRLFEIVQPQKAYFGEKDFQQLAIVRELVKQTGQPVEIVACPTVREADGLAKSSRNTLLTVEHRKAAPEIYRTMQEGSKKAGLLSVQEVKQYVTGELAKNPLLEVEYYEIVNAETLAVVTEWHKTPLRACIAVRAGSVRLIDNIDMTL